MQAKILLLDCQKMFVEGLRSLIVSNDLPYDVSVSCCTFEKALEHMDQEHFDILIFELNIQDLDGIGILSELEERKISIHKLILSSYNEPKFVRSAMLKGADGFVSKNSKVSELIQAIEEVLEGGIYIGEGLSITPEAYDIHSNGGIKRRIADSFTLRNKLTKRESEILEKIIERKNNKEIGKELYISHQTVGVHKKNIIKKLGLKSPEGLIKFAVEHNLVKV